MSCCQLCGCDAWFELKNNIPFTTPKECSCQCHKKSAFEPDSGDPPKEYFDEYQKDMIAEIMKRLIALEEAEKARLDAEHEELQQDEYDDNDYDDDDDEYDSDDQHCSTCTCDDDDDD